MFYKFVNQAKNKSMKKICDHKQSKKVTMKTEGNNNLAVDRYTDLD